MIERAAPFTMTLLGFAHTTHAFCEPEDALITLRGHPQHRRCAGTNQRGRRPWRESSCYA
jgi:hypothetical protein